MGEGCPLCVSGELTMKAACVLAETNRNAVLQGQTSNAACSPFRRKRKRTLSKRPDAILNPDPNTKSLSPTKTYQNLQVDFPLLGVRVLLGRWGQGADVHDGVDAIVFFGFAGAVRGLRGRGNMKNGGQARWEGKTTVTSCLVLSCFFRVHTWRAFPGACRSSRLAFFANTFCVAAVDH